MKPQDFLRELGWNHDISNARPFAVNAEERAFLIWQLRKYKLLSYCISATKAVTQSLGDNQVF